MMVSYWRTQNSLQPTTKAKEHHSHKYQKLAFAITRPLIWMKWKWKLYQCITVGTIIHTVCIWHHVCEIYLKAWQNLNQLKNKNRYSITHFYCPNYEEKTVILQSVGVIVKKFKKQVWLPILACILVSKLLNSVQQILYWSLNC